MGLCNCLIDDGRTFKVTLRQGKCPLPPPTASYRPAVSAEIREFNNQCNLHSGKGQGDELDAVVVRFIASHLKGWNVADGKGNPVPFDEATVAKLPHPYQSQLVDLITGYDSGELAIDSKNSAGASG